MRSVTFHSGNTTARLLAEGDRICAHVDAGKTFEVDSLNLWGSWCQRGAVVLDVGAYTGLFTIVARRQGCTVTAFEPMPFNAERFAYNCRMNGVSRALTNAAVSDAVGLAVIHYNPIPFTAGASLVRKTGAALTVRTVTIDSLELTKLDAIKIDVERAEGKVLLGARATLLRCKPKLLVEVLDDQRATEVEQALQGTGYRRVAQLDVRNWHMEAA